MVGDPISGRHLTDALPSERVGSSYVAARIAAILGR
jgi:hypothetical protein